ncbi:MAG TPA: WD40 repeat domain-containing protein [Vicinamibacterales bacterium]|nr:WD40 repeat domain-containing protein [Vicinamibacterales bacterium]
MLHAVPEVPPLPHRRLSALSWIAAAAGIALSVATLAASGPTFWTVGTAADLLKGRSDGVYVSTAGVLTAGPDLSSRLTSTLAQIWSLIQAPDGTLWAGTGGDGRVIQVRNGQPERTVFDSPESHVFALAADETRVFAATSPDGKVYAIDRNGTATTFFDPSEKYIWALAVDRQGRLWVGAGSPAVVYRVDASGASTVVYRPAAAHVVRLALDGSGQMLAGTASPGRLYRFDANDKPFVLLDSGLNELGAISVDTTGVIYAAAIGQGSEPSSAGEIPTVSASITVSSSASDESTATTTTTTTSSASSTSTTASAPERSVLYRIATDGTWEQFWSAPDVIYDLAAAADGVFVATGPSGRLYKVDASRNAQLFTGVDARQVTRFATPSVGGAPVAFATANPGRVLSIGASTETNASYTSAVHDTKSVATWGVIRWEGTGNVALATRSGNTETPDDSWSAWSSAYTQSAGERVTSPAARFLQWKATFTNGAAAATRASLTAVTVAYLARNTRPVVSSVTAHPPGVVFQRAYQNDEGAIAGLDDATMESRRPPGDTAQPTPQPGRRMFEHGLQTITWKADDEDDDQLVYSLDYRREGEQTWRPLKADLTDSIFVWDTTAVADGRYIVRVRASDSPSNAADRALAGERESDLIDVDNTPPTMTTTIARETSGAKLTIQVHDARSPIQKVEYSIGGGAWRLLYPADGLADSPDETYAVTLPNDTDASRVVIRATDALQNVMSEPATGR